MGRSEAARILAEVLAAQASGPPVVLATVVQAPPDAATVIGAKLLLRQDGSTLGSLGGGPLEEAALADARDAFRRRSVESLFYAADGSRLSRGQAEGVAAYQVMFERHEPAATLVIAGGGHIGKALATIGDLCGFSVVVIDDRPDYANQERFPEADRVVCGDFAEVLARAGRSTRTPTSSR